MSIFDTMYQQMQSRTPPSIVDQRFGVKRPPAKQTKKPISFNPQDMMSQGLSVNTGMVPKRPMPNYQEKRTLPFR